MGKCISCVLRRHPFYLFQQIHKLGRCIFSINNIITLTVCYNLDAYINWHKLRQLELYCTQSARTLKSHSQPEWDMVSWPC